LSKNVSKIAQNSIGRNSLIVFSPKKNEIVYLNGKNSIYGKAGVRTINAIIRTFIAIEL
jgi:hypothetical protein